MTGCNYDYAGLARPAIARHLPTTAASHQWAHGYDLFAKQHFKPLDNGIFLQVIGVLVFR